MLVHHDESEQYLGVGESERLTDAGSMMVLMMREHVLQRIKQSHNVLLRTGHNRLHLPFTVVPNMREWFVERRERILACVC